MTDFADEWRMLEDAQSWMAAAGYRLVASRGPEGMNQGYHVYVGARVAVRMIADRDDWYVEVRPDATGADASGWKDWSGVYRWSECVGTRGTLGRTPGRGERPTLAPQLDWLRANLAAVEAAAAAERLEATRGCLSNARRADAAFPPRQGGSARRRVKR